MTTDFGEMAHELDRLIEKFLYCISSQDSRAGDELQNFLWDNKLGILKALQAAAEEMHRRRAAAAKVIELHQELGLE